MEILKKMVLFSFISFTTLTTFFAQEVVPLTAFNYSYTLEYNGEFVKATEAIKKGYNEKSYETNLRAGWLNYEAGYYIESQNYYKKAIRLQPNSLEAKFGFIYPTVALGNMDQVIAQYDKILKIDPQNVTANHQLALIYYEKKDFDAAFKFLKKVVTLYPFGYDALLLFAWTNFQLGKNKDAILLFNKVLLIYPGDKSALEGLSLISED